MANDLIISKYQKDFVSGLEHVIGHLTMDGGGLSDDLDIIASGNGDVDFCMGDVARIAKMRTVVSWFKDRNLDLAKEWAYVSAKIDRIRQQQQAWQIGGNPVVYNLFSSWIWLVSDFEGLIDWKARYEPFYGWNGDQERPKEIAKSTYDRMFVGYQLVLAMRGEWQHLGDRTERWLAAPPSDLKKISPDMRFFLALAKGDMLGMEAALVEVISPKQRKWRSEWQSGYTDRLFAEEAVVYAKLAWRHGYQVDVDTPYIPKEWLPIAPLAEYTDPYEFMQGFDINQPLPAP